MVRQWLQRTLISFVTFAGMLAVMQMESPEEGRREVWKRPEFRQKNSWTRMYQTAVTATGLRKRTIKDQLREVLANDELAAQNPYANLGSDDTFEQIFKSNIKAFERQTLRSPSYQDESGYDLVHYEILHGDGTLSTILAYIDKGASAVELVVVMIMTPKGDKNEYAIFRDGTLEELSLIMPEEREALLAQRLDSGIPFLSVAR